MHPAARAQPQAPRLLPPTGSQPAGADTAPGPSLLTSPVARRTGYLPGRRPVLLCALLALVAAPEQALANAGTPLMWAALLHLVAGNTLLGLLEGALIARVFRTPYSPTIATLIAANYVSAWLGGLFLRGAVVQSLPLDLNNAWTWFWIMVPVTFALTLLLEWPFIAWLLRGTTHRWKRSAHASLLVQSCSYLLLFGWYWPASATSLYTTLRVVPPEQLSLPESVLVYFIDASDGHVHEHRLTGGASRKLLSLGSSRENDRLFVRPAATGTGAWDLVARLETEDSRRPRFVPVLTNLHAAAAPDDGSTAEAEPDYEGTWFNFGRVPRLADATNSPWGFWAGFWESEGLRGRREDTGERVQFAHDTPFGAWMVRNAVHLPTDKVLFQLGTDQICAFDPATRQIALLWRGRGPVPVIPLTASSAGREPIPPRQNPTPP